MRTLILTVELPDPEPDEPSYAISLRGMEASVEAHGLDAGAFVPILLMAAHNVGYQAHEEEHAENDPLLNPDIREALALQATRLHMLDALMHLPMIAPRIGIFDLSDIELPPLD